MDTKLGLVIKFDEKNTAISKKSTMLSCQQILMSFLFFLIYVKFGVIQKSDCRCTVRNLNT